VFGYHPPVYRVPFDEAVPIIPFHTSA